jgi:hypothetical protein
MFCFSLLLKSVLWGKKKKVWQEGVLLLLLLCVVRSLTVTVHQSTLWGENKERTQKIATRGLFAGGVITRYCTVYAVP